MAELKRPHKDGQLSPDWLAWTIYADALETKIAALERRVRIATDVMRPFVEFWEVHKTLRNLDPEVIYRIASKKTVELNREMFAAAQSLVHEIASEPKGEER